MSEQLENEYNCKNSFDKVFYAEASYSSSEIDAVIDVLSNSRLSLMNGDKVKELEMKIAKIFNKKYGLMVNSGSSANLLAILSLRLDRGSKVITPALTFSTTISPIIQSGLIPYFVDVEKETLQIDIKKMKEMDLNNVSAILVPNLIGNIANWEEIYNFGKENNLQIIEDSADTIGYEYKSNINHWSDISTTSFYASHIITGAGFGGMALFDRQKDYEYALSLRGWGRRSCQYGETEDFKRRFSAKVDGLYYDDKYIFDDIGYNFMPSEISAAFALIQLEKLSINLRKRNSNYLYLKQMLSESNNIHIPTSYKNVVTGWLAFPLIFVDKLEAKRKDIQIHLEKAGIQTRTIFSGNIMRQPVSRKFKWDCHGTFEISDLVMKAGILLGCHNNQTNSKLAYMANKILEIEKILI